MRLRRFALLLVAVVSSIAVASQVNAQRTSKGEPLPLFCEPCTKDAPTFDDGAKFFETDISVNWPGDMSTHRAVWQLGSAPLNDGSVPMTTGDLVPFTAVPQTVIEAGPVTAGGSGSTFYNGFAFVDFRAKLRVPQPNAIVPGATYRQAGFYYAIWVEEDTDNDGTAGGADCKPVGGDDCGYMLQTTPARLFFVQDSSGERDVRLLHVFRRMSSVFSPTEPSRKTKVRVDVWPVDNDPAASYTVTVSSPSLQLWVGNAN